jgi:hypothetical protein
LSHNTQTDDCCFKCHVVLSNWVIATATIAPYKTALDQSV